MILDEVSGWLDAATKADLEQAVEALLAGRTGAIIAHRPALLKRADLVIRLDEGADTQGVGGSHQAANSAQVAICEGGTPR